MAGAASAPSTRPSRAGPGPPAQIAAAKGGGCIRLGRGHSNLKLKSLFLLPQCNLQKWGLKVKERLRRQQLLTQEGDPAGHGRALLLEHTPGRPSETNCGVHALIISENVYMLAVSTTSMRKRVEKKGIEGA